MEVLLLPSPNMILDKRRYIMLSLLIQKELKNIILSPKFFATFLVCSVLILTSVYIGITEYQKSVLQFEVNNKLAQQNISQAADWGQVTNRLHREPTPMQIFVSGLHFDVGRLSVVSDFIDVKLESSPYSEDSMFAIFRIIDFVFIVKIVLSLFAILFTYDAINGERENGTLKLAFANSISRSNYLISKFLGIWSGLIIPLLIPILLSLLLIMVFNVPIMAKEWISILSIIGLSILYVTLFIIIGILISTITKNSSLSFLLLLVIWIGGIFIIPRLGVMASGQLVPVESVAQIESKQAAFEKARWDQYSESLLKISRNRNANMENMTPEERQTYLNDNEWEWLEEDDNLRKQLQVDILDNNRLLLKDAQNKKRVQERLALTISRISPVSSYQLAAMKLAFTDINMKVRYEESMRTYRDHFSKYILEKIAESGNRGGISLKADSERGITVDFGRDGQTLDTSELPQYVAPTVKPTEALASSILDFGILSLFIILSFGGCFFAFLRYDLR